MPLDLESMGLAEIIRLREQMGEVLVRRFEKNLALAFTDVVGSTSYFAEHGDEAGRALMQRHLDALAQAVQANQGRIVDTAGDGAFLVFPTVDEAVAALVQLQRLVLDQNLSRPLAHQLSVRSGIHHGPVLTDGVVVTGDAVNLCARITSTAQAGEVRMTKAAFVTLSGPGRMRCTTLPPAELKGIPKPVEMMLFSWSTAGPRPAWVTIQESGERFALPAKPVIAFGRLREHHGVQANDIVLAPAREEDAMRISRWHFEVRQTADGMCVSQLSDQITEVDGRLIPRGSTAPLRAGTVVRIAGVLTLRFDADQTTPKEDADKHTQMWNIPIGKL
jgi:class 3 adenylate cyclase